MELIHTTELPMKALRPNSGQIEGLPKNPRLIKGAKFAKLKQSIKDNPEMLSLRELLVYRNGDYYVIIGGNMRYMAMKELGYKVAPCKVIPEGTSVEQLRAYTIKDNAGFGEWDWDLLANEWDEMLLGDWGVDVWQTENKGDDFFNRDRTDEDARQEGNDEYNEFLDKFEIKKTTDDCYTPTEVYDAVVEWVENEYDVNRENFVRPFYPGGDYRKHNYPKECVVVDNPPFSILAEILSFYRDKGVRFFLFAPALTLFSTTASTFSSTAICVGVPIIYENKASVCTSFLTNLEPSDIRFRTSPTLYKAVKKAADKYAKSLITEFPRYSYPPEVATSAGISYLSKYGQEFKVSRQESAIISRLDGQKEKGKAIYGQGYLISSKAAEEKAAAEKAAEEKAAAEKWQLSEREIAIVKSLGVDKLTKN